MPRNGSGVYSPTAGIPVVSGTTISSTAFNNVIDDLGDEITASLPVSGVAPMTGVLRVTLGSVSAPGLAFVGDTDTGLYSTGANSLSLATNGTAALTVSATQTTTWTAKATGKAFDVDAITDVASASTCDIGAAATSEVNITGTTTITSFGTANAGIVRRGTFAGILTLTHNATSLILPGSTNITTAAGDSFVARSLGSGNWRVMDYTRALGSIANVVAGTGTTVSVSNGVATVNATGITQGTTVASTSGTTVDFTGLPSGLKRVTVMFSGVSVSGTDNLLIRLGTSGGVVATGYVGVGTVTAASTSATAETTGFLIPSGNASYALHGAIVFESMTGNVWTARGQFANTAVTAFISSVAGSISLGAVLDRVRILPSGANTFDAGSINILYE